MDTIAGNLANVHTTRGVGQAYQRRVPVFAVGASKDQPGSPGVHVTEILSDARPGRLEYQPGHIHAYPDGRMAGMVRMPNVDPLQEMINGMLAARAYEANITAMGATRAMANAALRIMS
jgi:flagellar basal-body rod protein FlgC